MRPTDGLFSEAKWMATGCAMGATGLGLACMMAAGAPLRYLAINVGALVVGFGLAGLLSALWRGGRLGDGMGTLAFGVLLLASSLFGVTVDGATRWITIGGLPLQPSLLLIPAMVVWFARSRGFWSMLGLVLASIAVALQPDRAMAGTMVAGLLALANLRWERLVLIALAASLAGFVATLVQIDAQPAMPFVDQILFTSFEVHPIAGLAVLGGVALLLAPAFIGRLTHAEIRDAEVAFGAVWLAVIVAAALGNYPTPLVGYGGSAIIGYVLSAFALPMVAENVAARLSATASAPTRACGTPISPPEARAV